MYSQLEEKGEGCGPGVGFLPLHGHSTGAEVWGNQGACLLVPSVVQFFLLQPGTSLGVQQFQTNTSTDATSESSISP